MNESEQKVIVENGKWTVRIRLHNCIKPKLFRHEIDVWYDKLAISGGWCNSGKKRIDPYMWFESHELWYNTTYRDKMNNQLWEDIILELVKMNKK